jgi:hypothetical protein
LKKIVFAPIRTFKRNTLGSWKDCCGIGVLEWLRGRGLYFGSGDTSYRYRIAAAGLMKLHMWACMMSTQSIPANGNLTFQLLMERLRAFLASRTRADSDRTQQFVIRAEGWQGFDIMVSQSGACTTVCFGDFVCDFDEPAEALGWIERALGGAYQLRVIYARDKPQSWSLEPVDNQSGALRLAGGTVSLLSAFRAKRTVILHNQRQLLMS